MELELTWSWVGVNMELEIYGVELGVNMELSWS